LAWAQWHFAFLTLLLLLLLSHSIIVIMQ